MRKLITIELPPDDLDLRRMIGDLGRVEAPENPYLGLSEGEIAFHLLAEAAEDRLRRLMAGIKEAFEEPSQAQPIAPGSYTSDTLPQLGARAQALLESIWDSAGEKAEARTPKKTRRAAKSRKPRGRLRLTDHGGESVIEYLAKR